MLATGLAPQKQMLIQLKKKKKAKGILESLSPITALYLQTPPKRLSYLQDFLDYNLKINEKNDSYLNLKYEDTNVMSVHSKLKQEDGRFEASLGNTVIPFLKNKSTAPKQLKPLTYAFQGS